MIFHLHTMLPMLSCETVYDKIELNAAHVNVGE